MKNKSKDNKTKPPKKNNAAHTLPASELAEKIGCSEYTVKEIRNGRRNDDTDIGHRVKTADHLYQVGTNLLIKEIERIVKL